MGGRRRGRRSGAFSSLKIVFRLSRFFACASPPSPRAQVLFRGVGRRWAALRSWTLPSLAGSLARGMVRVSPGPAVMFCRESHPLVRSGEFEPPSRILSMRGAEFVHRLRRDRGGAPPLLYGDEERVYLQALSRTHKHIRYSDHTHTHLLHSFSQGCGSSTCSSLACRRSHRPP